MAEKTAKRFNLHEALNRGAFDHAVITTFTFEPSFFEEYCLEKFRSLSSNGNISVLLDKGIYEGILLGPESERPKSANLRYLLFPVSVPGVFHPKLFLFASHNKGKLVLGSANFTRSGLTSNAEMVGAFDYDSGKNERHKNLFQQAFRYLTDLASTSGSSSLISNIQELARDAAWLSPGEAAEVEGLRLVNNLHEPLWEQVISGITSSVENVSILSRYFDLHPGFLDLVAADLKPGKIQIYTQNGVTNLSEHWLEHPLVVSGKVEIFLCDYHDDGVPQRLHAKAISIRSDSSVHLAYGSANFTTAALLRTSTQGNMEVLLKLPSASTRKLNTKKLFDPENSAVRLRDGAVLRRAPNIEEETIEERSIFAIDLNEAIVLVRSEADVLSVDADVPQNLRSEHLRCKLAFNDRAVRTIGIEHFEGSVYTAPLSEELKRRLNKESTVISIELFNEGVWTNASNSVLVTNLRDIKTDDPVRRERHLKQAEHSSTQFFAVLHELLESGDQQALLTFLNFCDIPLCSFRRMAFGGGPRGRWEGSRGMRQLGDRNLKIQVELHPAAVAFFDRHLKKLKRHSETRSVDGIENFLHIFLAMGGILRSQVERLVMGNEAKGSRISALEWGECRKYLDIYYSRFGDLIRCLWDEYLSRIAREYPRAEISERFLPELEAIGELCTGMLQYRERIEQLRSTQLHFTDANGRRVTPGYFQCIFEPSRWSRYSNLVEADLTRVEQTVRVAA